MIPILFPPYQNKSAAYHLTLIMLWSWISHFLHNYSLTISKTAKTMLSKHHCSVFMPYQYSRTNYFGFLWIRCRWPFIFFPLITSTLTEKIGYIIYQLSSSLKVWRQPHNFKFWLLDRSDWRCCYFFYSIGIQTTQTAFFKSKHRF